MKVINSEKLDVLDFPPIGIKFLLEDLLEEARNHTIDFEFGGEHYGEFKYENVPYYEGKAENIAYYEGKAAAYRIALTFFKEYLEKIVIKKERRKK